MESVEIFRGIIFSMEKSMESVEIFQRNYEGFLYHMLCSICFIMFGDFAEIFKLTF